MQELKKMLKENRNFIYFYSLFFVFSLAYIIFFPREHFLLFLNSIHNPFLDAFFKYITFLGDGLFILIIIIPIAFIRIRFAILTIITYLVSGLFSQIIKHIVQSPRPLNFLGNFENLHKVAGVDIYYFNSFPSGHTATAFAFFFLLAIITKNKNFSLLFFLFALFVGLSRIYLLQHFLVDVWAGSIIGVLTSLYFAILFERSQKINTSRWFNFSLYYWLRNH